MKLLNHLTYLFQEQSSDTQDGSSIKEQPETKKPVDEDKDEHPVFEALKNSKDNVEDIRNFFEIDGLSIEMEDSAGMTVLMHACWKGYEKIAKFLIEQVIIIIW